MYIFIWRRLLGGFLGFKRSIVMTSSIFCLLPSLIINYKYALFAWVVSMVYFSFGHIWSKGLLKLLFRYAFPAVLLSFFLAMLGYNTLLIALAGICIALVYYICSSNPEDCKKHGEVYLPARDETYYVIDGKMAYAEIIASILWYISVNISIIYI